MSGQYGLSIDNLVQVSGGIFAAETVLVVFLPVQSENSVKIGRTFGFVYPLRKTMFGEGNVLVGGVAEGVQGHVLLGSYYVRQVAGEWRRSGGTLTRA